MGTSCGDATDTECTNADECDGAGNCSPRDEMAGAPCGDQGQTCLLDDTCDGAGTCTDNGPMVGCEIAVTGEVRDNELDAPIAGITVQIVGSNPLVSDVTDANGLFTLAVPVGEPVLLHFVADGTHWGQVRPYVFEPSNPSADTTWFLTNTYYTDWAASVAGLPSLNDSKGIVFVELVNNSGVGGEEIMLSATSASPFAYDTNDVATLSSTLLGGTGEMTFINTTVGNTTVSVMGVLDVNTCTLDHPSVTQWPVIARTLTYVPGTCVDAP